jgi:hypothetical protein
LELLGLLVPVVLLLPFRQQPNPDSARTDRIVAAYAAAWNESDPAKRRDLLALSWAPNGQYLDPTASVRGRAALDAHIARFLGENPGARIEVVTQVDSHHSRVRFGWLMRGPQGQALIEGMDFGELGPDGKLVRIVGFFGAPKPRP